MLNRYPLWKYLLILGITVIGFYYAIPNLYSPDPAIQITGESSATKIDKQALSVATGALDKAGIPYFGQKVNEKGTSALIRLHTRGQQLPAQRVIQRALGDSYVVALNLASTTPRWLADVGAQPMKLGLDLSGGVHFLLQVATDEAVAKRMQFYTKSIKRLLRKADIRGFIHLQKDGRIRGKFKTAALRDKAADKIHSQYHSELVRENVDKTDGYYFYLSLSKAKIKQIVDYAVNQNLTTLRNRVNELGVSEPLVQRQGRNRIVVELPGIQDTAEAKRILGKTANLEFRLEAKYDAPASSKQEFAFRDPKEHRTAFLEKDVVITGDQVSNASAGFDSRTSRPEVNITLDSEGGTMMHRVTSHNIGRNLGVLFIERKIHTHYEVNKKGEKVVVKVPYEEKKIISLATIQDALGVRFRITGLDSPAEASELALLLRAGALAAPMDFVEERTIGPSLGAENIAMGIRSAEIGMLLVAGFTIIYYRLFGVIAVFGLTINLVLLIATMSILSATLTMPGIAGIVLTLGMAVDANVLIFERIKEELKNRMSPQQAINAGYDRAFVTIMDSNITTLLVAVILYAVGTGPVRGFAVTLSLGILTSMFTAIMGTRAVVNLTYGRRKKLAKLSI